MKLKREIFKLITFFFLAATILAAPQAYSQAPVITSFEPVKASYGEMVTINGSGFVNKTDMLVKFGAVAAKISESNATTIKVQVPAGATYAPISVTNLLPSGLTAYSPQPFMISFGGLKDSEPQFDPIITYTEKMVTDVCACDLDGDGKSDLVSSSETNTSFNVFLNKSTIGTINFESKFISTGIRTTLYVACGDLDGDGKADLVYTGKSPYNVETIILRNTSSAGNISFAPPQILTVAGTLDQPAIMDLNGDGKPEIILSNIANSQVAVFQNSSIAGSISFTTPYLPFSIPSGTSRGLRMKDVNNDGLADITVSSNYTNKVFFLLNNSSGGTISFQTPLEFSASNTSNHELEDFDGDGKKDLIALDYLNFKANVYLNNSSGDALSFAAAQSFTTGTAPQGLQLGDLNGDKKTDILIGHNFEGKAYLLVNTSTEGNLSFTTIILTGTGKFENVEIADLDGDARPDVAIADKGFGSLNIFRNKTCIHPTVNPAGTVDLCGGSSVTLSTVQSPAAELATPLITYTWLKDGAVVGTGYSLTTATSGDYSLQMTSTEGCSATSNTVTVNSFNQNSGTIVFDPIPAVCEGDPFMLSASPAVEGATYSWKNDISGFTETTSANSLSIAAADPALHAGTYTLTIKKGPCEITAQSQAVTISTKPVSSISVNGSLSICSGEERTLKTEEGFSNYQWKKNGEMIPNATSASYTASSTGSYTVLVKNANGCEAESEDITLSVNESLIARFESPATACLNQPVQFTDKSTLAPGQTPTYLWDFGDGTQSTSPSPTHTYTQTVSSTYTVSLVVQYEGNNCSSTFSKNIAVVETSNISLEAVGSTLLCPGDSVKVQITGDVQSVSWSNGDSGLFTYAKEGGILKADVLSTAGCTLTESIEIFSNASPAPEISAAKTTINKGESVQLHITGGVDYRWEPAESLDNPLIANPIATPAQTTTYKVWITGEQGCATEAEITIEVDDNFNVQAPKLFVPASDYSWTVKNIENYPEVSLTIVNKLGRTIFEAAPYQNDWTGTEKGTPLVAGVYFYVFKNASGSVLKTGSITLVQ